MLGPDGGLDAGLAEMSTPDGKVELGVAIFNEGMAAFLEGYSDDLNPYDAGSWKAEEWQTGWDAGYELHYREVQSDERDRELLKRRT